MKQIIELNPVNEYYYSKPAYGNKTSKINDPDLYVFATKVMVPICMKYAKYAFHAAVKTKATAARAGSDYHRAAFAMQCTSLNGPSSASDKHKVLCKLYKKTKTDDTIAIDYGAIVDGFYDMIASVIDNTVYFLPLSEIWRFQQEMGNACITQGGRYIAIPADYFIDYSCNSAPMQPEDIEAYDQNYERYVMKSYKLRESRKLAEKYRMLNESALTETCLIDSLNNKELQDILYNVAQYIAENFDGEFNGFEDIQDIVTDAEMDVLYTYIDAGAAIHGHNSYGGGYYEAKNDIVDEVARIINTLI